jgi:hypothetical protein
MIAAEVGSNLTVGREAGKLRAPDQPKADRQRIDSVVPSRSGVVVGQGQHINTSRRSCRDELCGGVRSIGLGGVSVQVNTHDRSLHQRSLPAVGA